MAKKKKSVVSPLSFLIYFLHCSREKQTDRFLVFMVRANYLPLYIANSMGALKPDFLLEFRLNHIVVLSMNKLLTSHCLSYPICKMEIIINAYLLLFV